MRECTNVGLISNIASDDFYAESNLAVMIALNKSGKGFRFVIAGFYFDGDEIIFVANKKFFL